MKIRCPKIIKKLFSPVIKLYNILLERVKKSIRLELVLIFGICLLISVIVGSIANNYYGKRSLARIDYSYGARGISEKAANMADSLRAMNVNINDSNRIQEIMKQYSASENMKLIISDLDGKVLYKSDNVSDTQIDIYNSIKSAMETTQDRMFDLNPNAVRNKEYTSIYPINFNNGRGYLIASGVPEGTIVYENEHNPIPRTIAILATFLLSFYFMTNKKMRYIEIVSNGLLEISKGNLDYRIKKYGEDELASLANNINFMAEELKSRMDYERKAEKAKTELITNVSHDLRTPLTSIKGYLGLIKEKKYGEPKQLEEYVNIVYNKAERLEVLINDLFEYTKLTNKGVIINSQKIALNDLLEQLVDELVQISEENDMTLVEEFINEKVVVDIDPDKTVRVFENLLMNAIRYSKKPGEIKIILKKEEDLALVSVQNRCENMSDEDLEKIFDRFYRVEKSRSSDTGGSGLGLAIAKNIVELQGGSIEAKHKEEDISFDVRFKLYNE